MAEFDITQLPRGFLFNEQYLSATESGLCKHNQSIACELGLHIPKQMHERCLANIDQDLHL